LKVSLRDSFEYIPVWNDNKELPDKEQIKVKMHFLTGMDLSECVDSIGKVDKLKEWGLICETVDNLYDGDDPATPEDIATKGGFAELYIELKLAYKNETAIDKKK
jgi:hypothetical protein